MTNEVKEEKTAFLFQTLDKFINEKINLIVGELKEDSSLDKEVAKKLGITTTTLYMYINGCNEIIVEGENGTIIPVKNVEAISTAMQKTMEDKNYYLSLKNNARLMIQSRYEQSVVWNALLDEYNMLIKKLDIKN